MLLHTVFAMTVMVSGAGVAPLSFPPTTLFDAWDGKTQLVPADAASVCVFILGNEKAKTFTAYGVDPRKNEFLFVITGAQDDQDQFITELTLDISRPSPGKDVPKLQGHFWVIEDGGQMPVPRRPVGGGPPGDGELTANDVMEQARAIAKQPR